MIPFTATAILDRLAPAIAGQIAILATIPAELGDGEGYNPDHAVPAATLDGLARCFTRECASYVTDLAQRLAEERGLAIDDTLLDAMDALLAAGYEGGKRGWRSPAQAAQLLADLAWTISATQADRARAVLIGTDLSLQDDRYLRTMRSADPQFVVASWIARVAETQA